MRKYFRGSKQSFVASERIFGGLHAHSSLYNKGLMSPLKLLLINGLLDPLKADVHENTQSFAKK